ncbi:5-(carboxyamino)imidazole ribonucleotide synthase [Pseudoclavibacter albus]|uniref:5-(carboxyamino)imidazole ribonucleotide synthase n=1 Tax=Pseudoclavibacter albus TaxID=272241 RepID=UPI0008270A64|nr:5-(carboxyamino)imidazole ribonucleotide synthase [Pseudoclavibacter alba]
MAQTIGVIGGGQLARMMVPPAIELGLEIKVLGEAEGSSARPAVTQVGDYRDREAVLEFAKTVDVITFDHEHVPPDILNKLIAAGHTVHPGPGALRFAQDKLDMRRRLTELGAPIPEWTSAASVEDVDAFIREHGGEAVVKTPRGGYDGKGVRVVREGAEAADWFTDFPELLVEEKVPFTRELAQLIARRPSGASAQWTLAETVQVRGVCAEVIAPAPGASAETIDRAAEIARLIAEGLEVTGVLAVEMFETADGRLLVNELAMRPHNSGHWTQEGALTSQFEQHLRAVLDLPLGDPSMVAPHAVMVNILGGPQGEDVTTRFPEAMREQPAVKIHTYGKSARPGRKVGHVNAIGQELESTVVAARAAAAIFESEALA